jgi:drug/metabolite transporter (DMT)-like permease
VTPGIGFALIAMLCFGAADLMYKRAALAGMESRHFIMAQAWGFCPTMTVYAIATGTLQLVPAALWGSLAGLFSLVAFYNFAQSLRTGAISTNAPIFRLNFTLTAALAVLLLGESLSLLKLAGLAIALVAVWMLLGGPAPGRGRPSPASLARVLIATAALGFANLFYKIGLMQGANPETLLSTQAWVFCSLATLFVFAADRRLQVPHGIWVYSVPASILFLVGFVVLLHGLAAGPASVLVPVAQLGFVVTALLGVVLLGESLTRRKQTGLAAAAAALVLLAVS